jgi:hypothetical protein
MRVEFAPEARAEFEEAQRYYERQLPGLGERFRTEIREALVRLRNWPLAAPVGCKSTKYSVTGRCSLHKPRK